MNTPFISPRTFLGYRQENFGFGFGFGFLPLLVRSYAESKVTSPLLACVERGSLSGCAALLRAGADPLLPPGEGSPSPLHAAAARFLAASSRADAEFKLCGWPGAEALARTLSVFALLSRATDRVHGAGSALTALPPPMASQIAALMDQADIHAGRAVVARLALTWEATAHHAAPRGTALGYAVAGPSLRAAADAADAFASGRRSAITAHGAARARFAIAIAPVVPPLVALVAAAAAATAALFWVAASTLCLVTACADGTARAAAKVAGAPAARLWRREDAAAAREGSVGRLVSDAAATVVACVAWAVLVARLRFRARRRRA